MKPKTGNIEDLNTVSIIWNLVYRHRVVLLITSNIVTLLIWLMQQGPVAISNLTH